MTRVCVVKQNSTYDLYKVTGPDLQSIVESSNFRSGPVGLWEAFDCDYRVVLEDPAAECQFGKQTWEEYVAGWDIWPAGFHAERADDIDWSQYDIVIGIDVAVPTRIVRKFPAVLWCYYLIEWGALSIRSVAKGSPFYSYNVFLSQDLAKDAFSPDAAPLREMRATKRTVLSVPYFLQSSRSIRGLYSDAAKEQTSGICLSDHSAEVASDADVAALRAFGPLRMPSGGIRDVLQAKVRSKYFVVHPASRPRCGNALIEAISAGSLVVAPSRLQWGYPELVSRSLDFDDFRALLRVLERLESDQALRERELETQRARVDAWCYVNPCTNLEAALFAFRQSRATRSRQALAEARARVAVGAHRVVRGLGHRILRSRG